jgi:chitin disaccharide deacetylase
MTPVSAVAQTDARQGKRLIVSADEFGCSPEINRRVLAAHSDGILTSASLVVTGAAATEAGTLAQEHLTLDVGLSVALTGGAPVLPAFEVPSLSDEQGRLAAQPSALAGARPQELLDEMRAQHRRFRQLVGRPPSHLDVKDDAHLQRPVFDALLTLAWEMGVPVRGVTPAMRLQLRREDLSTIDHFLELPTEGGVAALWRLLDGIEDGVSELRCGPDRVVQAAAQTATASSEPDWNALRDAKVRAAIASLGIQLIHFGQL